MSIQILPQSGSISGRIGKGIGQGLSAALPKVVERKQLSEGLRDFEKNSEGLTPLQQYTRLASIPGITPSMLQALPEILKQQNLKTGYQNKSGKREREDIERPQKSNFDEVNFANLNQNQRMQTQNENVKPEAFGQPQVVNTNPLRPEAIPKSPWTVDKRNAQIAQNYEDFPGITHQENLQMVNDQESRDLAQPEAEQARDTYIKGVQKEADDKFIKKLETKLQKSGEGVFTDISGEMLNNLQRGMERDLRTNPKATVDDVVNKWTNKALDLAKTKKQVDTLSGESQWATPILLNKEAYRNKLEEYADIFEKAGNSEEYYNILQRQFNLSPQGAASVAFKRNEKLKKYANSVKPQKMFDYTNYGSQSRKYAADIEDLLSSNDSILAVARDLRMKDPFFDQKEFFDQLSEDKDVYGFNPRQRREIAEGVSGILPTWGDVLILPIFRGLE